MRENARAVKVIGSLPISRMCLACGEDNALGFHSQYLVLEDGRICCRFTALPEHQGYPDRMHGGAISTVLDEAIGRLIQVGEPEMFGVTVELNVKFRKPVPIGVELMALVWVTKQTARVLEGEGEILLVDGTPAAHASAVYVKMPAERVTQVTMDEGVWFEDAREYPEVVYL